MAESQDKNLGVDDVDESGMATPMSIDRQFSQAKASGGCSNNLKMRHEVKHYLSDDRGYPSDLCTDEYVELFLKNRAKNHNRGKYTIRGDSECPEAQKIAIEGGMVLHKNPIGLIRLLADTYEPMCEDCISNLDIYTLPSFNLNNLDDYLADAINLDDLADGMMDGVSVVGGMTGIGGGDDGKLDDDIDVDQVFEKWDKNGSKKLEKQEFFEAIKELEKMGIDFDVNHDGDSMEEIEALFDLLDEDDDEFISYEEFASFVEEYRGKDERDVLDAYTVFDWHPLFGPFVFVFVYILYGMSIITQFMIPTMITLSYLHGDLGEDDAKYKVVLDYEGQATPPGPHYGDAFCPNTEDWDIKLSGMMLFLFLLVATPVADLVASIYAGGEDEEYYLIKHSRFCEDTFFKKTAPVINLLCFGTILVTTYLLFMSAPQVDQLLLNVIAVNFLIEVDNIAITTVIDEKVKSRMVAKMVMWYIVEGEKSKDEQDEANFYYLKLILGTLFGHVAGWIGIVIYTLSWFQPILVYACM